MNILEQISARIAPADRTFYDWQLALATRICQIIETQKLTASEFADKVGVSEEQLDQLLHFCADPPLSTIARIAALTQTDVLTWVNSDVTEVSNQDGRTLASA